MFQLWILENWKIYNYWKKFNFVTWSRYNQDPAKCRISLAFTCRHCTKNEEILNGLCLSFTFLMLFCSLLINVFYMCLELHVIVKHFFFINLNMNCRDITRKIIRNYKRYYVETLLPRLNQFNWFKIFTPILKYQFP